MRTGVLGSFADVADVIARHGGEEDPLEVLNAVRDVTPWWP